MTIIETGRDVPPAYPTWPTQLRHALLCHFDYPSPLPRHSSQSPHWFPIRAHPLRSQTPRGRYPGTITVPKIPRDQSILLEPPRPETSHLASNLRIKQRSGLQMFEPSRKKKKSHLSLYASHCGYLRGTGHYQRHLSCQCYPTARLASTARARRV